MQTIAFFRSPVTSKFGAPKQSGLASSLRGRIEFVPEWRNVDALRGIDGFDYLWLLWGFSANGHVSSSPVVRPPVLGGNERVGVFASRSPFRPNPVGLSSVRLVSVDWNRVELVVAGADLIDRTPIYDIKPYLPYTDSHPEARSGFSRPVRRLDVVVPPQVAARFTADELSALRELLALDPRPRYHDDAERVYGMPFRDVDVHFRVSDGTVVIVSL